jgi:isopenicillin N synthase-like dioxygenase
VFGFHPVSEAPRRSSLFFLYRRQTIDVKRKMRHIRNSNKEYQYARVSIHAPVSEITNSLQSCDDGVLLIEDLPPAPFEAILHLLQNPLNVGHRLNQACPDNVVIYKDPSFGDTKKNKSNVDQKCTLDISPERLASIAKVDPDVVEAVALQEPLSFFQGYQSLVNEKLIPALGQVIGGSKENSVDLVDDISFSYRMIDYYPTEGEQQSSSSSSSSSSNQGRPRLAEHRDFGFLTLIQASQAGLQVRIGNQWKNIPHLPPGTAILMGGWCARIRTNGRLPAILHRVPKHLNAASVGARGSGHPSGQGRRISAVLFCNPKRVDTCLEPMVQPGETRQFIEGVTAGSLQQRLAESKTERSVDEWLAFRNGSTCTTSKRTATRTATKNSNHHRSFWSRFPWRR